MGVTVAAAIGTAGKSMVRGDTRSAEEIVAHDHRINEQEMKLEQKALEIIALHQPITNDLRDVVTILKAVSDLEHAGDHARDIALASIQHKQEPALQPILTSIEKFSMFIEKLMRDMLSAYVKKKIGVLLKITAHIWQPSLVSKTSKSTPPVSTL